MVARLALRGGRSGTGLKPTCSKGLAMDNIDSFNRFTATILSALYRSFPVPRPVDHRALADEVLEVLGVAAWEADTLQRAVHRNDAKARTLAFKAQERIAWYTIAWLRECDYIRRTAETEGEQLARPTRWEPAEYVLSPKGLEVLSAVPATLEGKASSDQLTTDEGNTYGEKLTEVLQSASGEAGKAAISKIVGTVIGAALRAFLPTSWGLATHSES
jgi:hypothetical protein